MSEENLTLYSRIVQAAKTHEEWQEINPVLKCGEKIYVITSQQPWTLSCKVGDGQSAYIELPFYSLMQGEDVKVNALHGTAGGLRTRAGALGFRIIEMSSHNDTTKNNSQLYYDEGWYKIDPNGLSLDEFMTLISAADAAEEDKILYSLFMKASGDRVGIVTNAEYVDNNQYIKLTVAPYQHPNRWYQLTDAEKQLCYDSSYIFFDKFPDIGNIPVADCAVAFGCDSSALAHSSFTAGANNMSLGKMSFTSGNQTTAGYCAMATGIYSKAMGYHSHAQNYRTQALGMDSSASGRDTIASGVRSDAGGHQTVASGENSVARGSFASVTKNEDTPEEEVIIYPTTASGKNSFAGGAGSEAIGNNSIAFGTVTINTETKEVTTTQARGANSVALGQATAASGDNAVALGQTTQASGKNAVAINYDSKATGSHSFAAGYQTEASGSKSAAFGSRSIASGENSVAIHDQTKATEKNSFAAGYQTTASAKKSVAFGSLTIASGENSVAMHDQAQAIGTNSFATGYKTEASGENSTALGKTTKASGENSFSQGNTTEASGINSMAAGYLCKAKGPHSEAGGHSSETDTKAQYAVAKGYSNIANHKGAALFGGNHTSYRDFQFIAGRFSATPTKDSYALIGIGTLDTKRKNGLEVHADGTVAVGAPGVEDNEVVTVDQVHLVKKYTLNNYNNDFYLILNDLSVTTVTNFEIAVQYNESRGGTGTGPILEIFNIFSDWAYIESEPWENEEYGMSVYYQPQISLTNKISSVGYSNIGIQAYGTKDVLGYQHKPVVLEFRIWNRTDYNNITPTITITCKNGNPNSIEFSENSSVLLSDIISITDRSSK